MQNTLLYVANNFINSIFIFSTTFNIVRQPESLGLLEAESPEDYNSIGEIRVRVYDRVQMLRKLKIGSITPADQNAIYTIEIKTGNRKDAGTDATVYIRLTGTKNGVCLPYEDLEWRYRYRSFIHIITHKTVCALCMAYH